MNIPYILKTATLHKGNAQHSDNQHCNKSACSTKCASCTARMLFDRERQDKRRYSTVFSEVGQTKQFESLLTIAVHNSKRIMDSTHKSRQTTIRYPEASRSCSSLCNSQQRRSGIYPPSQKPGWCQTYWRRSQGHITEFDALVRGKICQHAKHAASRKVNTTVWNSKKVRNNPNIYCYLKTAFNPYKSYVTDD